MASVKKEKLKQLPIVDDDHVFKDMIENLMKKVFKKLLYAPLIKALGGNEKTLQNSRSDLLAAIAAGRITHDRGVFRGKFSAAVSKELRVLGAKWSDGTFSLPIAKMPKDVRKSIEVSEKRFQAKLELIEKKLYENLPAEIAGSIDVTNIFSTELFRVSKDIDKTLKSISVMPELSEKNRLEIAEGWSNNLQLTIKDFANDEIKKLRFEVSNNAYAGNRYESLAKTIQESYGVTARKATFLARQETNLLLSEFKKTRYLEAGVDEYEWICVAGSSAHPVRPSHKALDRKIFSWHNPPITTEPGEPERRNHPGQDFGCRCRARPIVRF